MLTDQNVNSLRERFPSMVENELLSKHTSLRIGGPARLYFVAEQVDEMVAVLKAAQEMGVPFYVLGGGSNVLVSDQGFDGLVVQMAFRAIQVRRVTISAYAGAITSALCKQASEAGLSGLEWAAGLPGTVGGAVYGNAGCYGGEIQDNLVSVDVLTLPDLKRVPLPKAECRFGYRDSRFKHEPYIILMATFGLKAGDFIAIKKRMDEVMEQRKGKQPHDHPSAGCMFKNFVFNDESEIEILKRQIKDIPAEMLERKSISAGWLVDQVGMRGERIGDAQVSEQHGNFLVNMGNARAQDVLMLTSKVKMKVRDELGIMLEDEVQLVGF